jgi:hypothetical protein
MRRLWTTTIAVAGLLAGTTLGPAGTTAAAFPDRIDLPDGFAPEGIATGRGSTFYTGSLTTGGIWRGDYRTGDGDVLIEVTPEIQGPFVGISVDARSRLWVAGGGSGSGHVFDGSTGARLATFTFASDQTFVNDVVVTTDAAYFTDSFRGLIYRVGLAPDGEIGPVTELDLRELAEPQAGVFRLNGIDATPNGKMLVVVNSTAGELYAVDTATESVTSIDLDSTALNGGDGLLLIGRTLYVVSDVEGDPSREIAVIELSPDLTTGTLVSTITSDDFDVPTTIARFGASLYVVNARFGTPVTEDTEYWITRLGR